MSTYNAAKTLEQRYDDLPQEIVEIRRTLDVPQTGKLDVATLQEVADVLPQDRIRTTQQMRSTGVLVQPS